MKKRLEAAAALLKSGQVVIVPTDTAYGLAADARNARAIATVKRLKGRATNKPIALIAADVTQVRRFFHLSPPAARLARQHWPGPLTLVLRPRSDRLAVRALSLTGRVGVRVPARAAARRLCTLVRAPLTATSANRSGFSQCYTVGTARRSLRLKLPALDAGPLPRRAPSTLVRVDGNRLTILRRGPITPTFAP